MCTHQDYQVGNLESRILELQLHVVLQSITIVIDNQQTLKLT